MSVGDGSRQILAMACALDTRHAFHNTHKPCRSHLFFSLTESLRERERERERETWGEKYLSQLPAVTAGQVLAQELQ